jgi:cell wall-associated NlpC family hydrolase
MNGGTEKGINARNTSSDEIISTARKYLGVPHCMGGTTMKCMDCSGLLVTVFGKYGIKLPHNSEEQGRYGKIIKRMDELKKGDLVFFIRSYKTNRFITHSGIYIGDNKFIHTSSTVGVTITSLSDPWWNEKFIFGTRVFD